MDFAIIAIGIALAIAIRYSLLNFQSVDYAVYTRHWYTYIKAHGFSAFGQNFSNYNPPYLYLLYIVIRFFPDLPSLTATKLPSMIADFICACLAYMFVNIKYSKSPLPMFATFAFLFAPTVILNSAFWGQADVLYTIALIASLYFLIKKKNVLAILSFGVSISFKLQAVFLLPLLFALFFRKEIPWKYFLLIPLVLFLALIPSWLAGRSLTDLLSIYFSKLTLSTALYGCSDAYLLVTRHPISTRLFYFGSRDLYCNVSFFFATVVYKSQRKIDSRSHDRARPGFCLVRSIFLPKMHDRYFYPADVFSIVFAFFFPEYFFVPVIIELISFFSYQPTLFNVNTCSISILSGFGVFGLLVLLVKDMVMNCLGIGGTDQEALRRSKIKGTMKSSTTAIPLEKLLEQLPSTYTLADKDLIQRAYRVAEEAHRGQKRNSGEPYINHCLAVAQILAELHVPPEVLAAGLLHDTVEDTTVTLDGIRNDFGDVVAKLVDGVTKLTNLPRVSRDDQHAERAVSANGEVQVAAPASLGRKADMTSETLRKTFLAMGDDVRVVLIKLADRLHNMRTLSHMPAEKRIRIAQQTLDIFAPLANRLGIWQIKWELEDLAFRYVNPQKYKEIAEQLAERRPDRETQIEAIMESLRELFEKNNIKIEISGRPKHIYSIYKKMQDKGKAFEAVRDVRAVRLIVPDIASCYTTLGIIHTNWRPIPNEFDDYIAAPKDNFYQSLHTAVIWDDGKPLEVQIRTSEMHQNAEYGIAAHWRYKEGTKRDKSYEQRINWLRNMMEWHSDVNDATEFVELMRTDVFQDRVYVFTPRGDIIDLPAGSTPIDFAYHVHTDIGHCCRGAKVNGKLVPLYHELKTGDQVEILTAKRGGPSRDWLNSNLGLVKTQRAKSKIRQWFKEENFQQNLSQGRLVLERELQRLGIPEANFEKMARNLGIKSPDEMFVDLGTGDLSVSKVIKEISETEENANLLTANIPKPDITSTEAVDIVGLRGLLTTMGRCCNPAPGDQIIGYITRGRGATIHRQDCPNILRLGLKERERIVRVDWGQQVRTFPVSIRIKAYDRQGLMSDVTNLLSDEGVNIADAQVNVNRSLAELRLIVEVEDISQLSKVLTRLENVPNVMEAHRVSG